MGLVANIKHDEFPQQGGWKDKRVKVCFHHDLDHIVNGTVVRDDMEEPYQTIISLDDGRYVLSTECQYSLAD